MKKRDRKYKRNGHGHDHIILMNLHEKPKDLVTLKRDMQTVARRFGFFMRRNIAESEADFFKPSLERLVDRGWVDVNSDGKYYLTEAGRQEAETAIREGQQAMERMRKLLDPGTTAKITVVIHFVLAALKLPAGFLSGSAGLINDALDTLLDGVASLIVYAGIRLKIERVANSILILLMLLTGGFTLYESVRRFFVPVTHAIDWLAFIAIIVSALICGILWALQRYVGLKSGAMALITQSIDSRNHVIVAGGVLIGLIATLIGVPLIDTLVGLIVALIILKSAVELALEMVRSAKGEEIDLTRYEFGLTKRWEKFRDRQLQYWLMYLIEKGKAQNRDELIRAAQEALNFQGNYILKHVNMDDYQVDDQQVEATIQDIFDKGWLQIKRNKLKLTQNGREVSHKYTRFMHKFS